MTTIAQLPNEILLDIFEWMKGGNGNLVNAMKTCRRWHQLASTTIYRHITMCSKLRDDTTTARFAASATQCDLVQSFSLNITQVHLMGFSILSFDAFDRLVELCDAVSSMRKLQTFALSFEKAIGQGFKVSGATIVQLLQSLPGTVVNLNLDCECLDSPDLGQPHVCEAVGALLPRLRSLRLRTSHLCAGLFKPIAPHETHDLIHHPNSPLAVTQVESTSALEFLIICLVLRPEYGSASHTNPCFAEDHPMQGSRLSSTLCELQKAGLFPSLQQFAVVGRVDALSTPQNDNWNVFKVRYLTQHSMTTITLPWCARGGSSSLYMIRDEEEDWFGSFDEITSALEGSMSWTNAGIKSRSRGNSLRSDWQLDRSMLASRVSVINNFGVSFRLWKHEEAVNMRLLHARTAPGFDDMATSCQIVPGGWRWVPEGPWDWTIAAA
jgi:hypothetical protein